MVDPQTLHRQLTVVDAHSDILKDVTDGRAWVDLCQMLLAGNAFLYVE